MFLAELPELFKQLEIDSDSNEALTASDTCTQRYLTNHTTIQKFSDIFKDVS